MNYEEAFRHYREGTATEEEKAYVQEEIAKAKALSTLLDDEALAVKPAPIKEADAKEVKEAKQQLIWKRVLAGLLSIVALLLILGAVLGGVFGSAAAYAKEAVVYSKGDATQIATVFAYNDAVAKFGFTGDISDFYAESTREVDSKFNFEGNLKGSYYTYKVEVKGWSADGWEYEYEVEVNSKTGSCSVLELERDREGYFRG